jgi:hypothetical protein
MKRVETCNENAGERKRTQNLVVETKRKRSISEMMAYMEYS